MDCQVTTLVYVKWSISSLTCYWISILGISLFVRLVLSSLKALAMRSGEHLPIDVKPDDDPYKDHTYLQLLKLLFSGKRNKTANSSDYWLGYIIGVTELAAYPVLIHLGQLAIIGAWLGLKTAGHWRIWANSRTAFNRFLLANLINIFVSYFWLSGFVVG
jgi:hypothetical protein